MTLIQKRMKALDREALKTVRAANKRGSGYQCMFAGASWYNALERLVQSKRIRFYNTSTRYGYWVVKAASKKGA